MMATMFWDRKNSCQEERPTTQKYTTIFLKKIEGQEKEGTVDP